MIEIIAVILSIEVFFFVYMIFAKGLNKIWMLAPIYVEMVIILSMVTKEPAYFGFVGVLGFLPLLLKTKNDKN